MRENPTKLMVVRTLIYGVRPAGNITIAGLKKLAEYARKHHPDHINGAAVLEDDTYVDDLMSAQPSEEVCMKTAKSILFTLSLASMEVKGFTFAGRDPDPELSGGCGDVLGADGGSTGG